MIFIAHAYFDQRANSKMPLAYQYKISGHIDMNGASSKRVNIISPPDIINQYIISITFLIFFVLLFVGPRLDDIHILIVT